MSITGLIVAGAVVAAMAGGAALTADYIGFGVTTAGEVAGAAAGSADKFKPAFDEGKAAADASGGADAAAEAG